MKWLFILSVLFIVSCGNHSSQALSVDQRGLFNLSRDYRSEFNDTTDSRERERLIIEYELKLQEYLRHRCSYRLEAMRVQLKNFEEDGKGRVYARFVDRNNEYVFQMVYDSTNEMKADTVYQLVKSIPPGRDIAVRFLFAGNVKINEPAKESSSTFQIEVTPTAVIETKGS